MITIHRKDINEIQPIHTQFYTHFRYFIIHRTAKRDAYTHELEFVPRNLKTQQKKVKQQRPFHSLFAVCLMYVQMNINIKKIYLFFFLFFFFKYENFSKSKILLKFERSKRTKFQLQKQTNSCERSWMKTHTMKHCNLCSGRNCVKAWGERFGNTHFCLNSWKLFTNFAKCMPNGKKTTA